MYSAYSDHLHSIKQTGYGINQFQKLSLSKLEQVKMAYSNNLINKTKLNSPKSHIVFVNQQSDRKNNQPNGMSDLMLKNHRRRKIFQNVSKNNQMIDYPTFNKIAEQTRSDQFKQNTQYYSMSSSDFNSEINHQVQQNTAKRVRFGKQNQIYDYFQHTSKIHTENNQNILKNLPILEQKILTHDGQLKKIKKYLKVNESIILAQNQKLVEQNDRLNKQKHLNQLRKAAKNQIESRQAQIYRRQSEILANIQKQRTSRIQKIQKQNQSLKLQISYQEQHESDLDWSKSYPFSNQTNQTNKQGHFRKKSKNKEKSLQYNSHQSGYKNDCSMSPSKICVRNQNQFSNYKFSTNISLVNKVFDSFSIQNNTFRQILSPLDFQPKQNQSFW